ncbi:hypothetical protein BU24DRAFT_472663 [Aaosphaeria arxii CBS 175.79]|uniref:DUF7730 domain-containing protein n=1 Tax=Aaosphaeria arxii CBS 175.79 TaxID=1450172 RepID=A0A6A5XC94_9PLEO|nr:uncharacterized protein BU24DRAFT_472663 [Aaosphaeria arxii CBS 175.79]KAF2010511.1 hypothetical protein BU24DRAFT_472663 [Aaosphaeria arxii CBS 175.79]
MPENSPESGIDITPQAIRKAVEGRVHKSNKVHKISLLAVLQTCQMIYLETSRLLYQANTFVSLQNSIPIDFCNLALPAHLSLITSLHVHFQFREFVYIWDTCPGRQDPDPYNESTFHLVCRQISQSMPNLRALSIFLQGPLVQPKTYDYISSCLTSMRDGLKDLYFMAVRFPHLALEELVAAVSGLYEDDLRRTYQRLDSMRDRFHVLQPCVGNDRQQWEIADLDTGREKGWRLGTMYRISNLGLDSVEMRNYAIFTEAEAFDEHIEKHEP